jgi:dTDP-4-amino-4,6-dideoxygalactose transaminase
MDFNRASMYTTEKNVNILEYFPTGNKIPEQQGTAQDENIQKRIFVTRPSLPPLHEFVEYLSNIWDSGILTNNGNYHKILERELADFLGVKYLSLFSNGTLALISALQVLRITGEVITTPYSFVASTHAIQWNGLKPVFCDIDENTLNLDPSKIESLITPQTSAILPVHVYGNPCNVQAIQSIADTYNLKVIYDACHAFGVKLNGETILNYGDLSVLSFHATKVFTTGEGGAIICHDENTKKKIDFLKNFGFANETTVVAPGINAKMNEIQSALGLVQIKHVDEYIEKRKAIAKLYRDELVNCKGIRILNDFEGVQHNFAYFPIFVDENEFGMSRDELYDKLKSKNIFGRRYFYPLISQFPSYRQLESAKAENLPVAEKITKQVLCLPIYPDLEMDEVTRVIHTILNNGR